jgi:hypothetical protein
MRVKFDNGDRRDFYGRDDIDCLCAAYDYAEAHDTRLKTYKDITAE